MYVLFWCQNLLFFNDTKYKRYKGLAYKLRSFINENGYIFLLLVWTIIIVIADDVLVQHTWTIADVFHWLIFTFCFIPYYILLPSSFPCHETMNTDDTPLIVVTSHNMTSQYKSTPRRTVNCFVTSCWQRQRCSVNSSHQ
jgi:hypothetical protein